MKRQTPNHQYDRRGTPATIAELIAIAAWKAEGDAVSAIARRCRRPGRKVRAIMEDREI